MFSTRLLPAILRKQTGLPTRYAGWFDTLTLGACGSTLRAPRPAALTTGRDLANNAVGGRSDPISPITRIPQRVSEPPKPVRQRRPSNFRQQDVARAIKAAKGSGLDIVRVEVDPKTAKIVLVVKNDDDSETKVNPFDNAPVHDPALRRRKTKASCKSK